MLLAMAGVGLLAMCIGNVANHGRVSVLTMWLAMAGYREGSKRDRNEGNGKIGTWG